MPKMTPAQKIKALRECLSLCEGYLTARDSHGVPTRMSVPPDYLLSKIEAVKRLTGRAKAKVVKEAIAPMFDGADEKPSTQPGRRAKYS